MATVATDTATPQGVDSRSEAAFVSWSAVIGGAVLAAAISFVLLTFGTAIGLSATSPWPSSGLPAAVIASLAVFWVVAQQIGAFLAGGYVAGRMRPRLEAAADEIAFRDGLHGGLVWALGIVIGAALAMAAGGALSAGGDIGARATTSASTLSPMELTLDALLRPVPGDAAPNRAEASADDARAELSRILASSIATGPLSDQSRAYAAQRVSQLTGLPQQEAETRVAEALTATRRAADRARRAAVLTGFVTAASLVISLAAAWWAAVKGGEHRDSKMPAAGPGRDRRQAASGS